MSLVQIVRRVLLAPALVGVLILAVGAKPGTHAAVVSPALTAAGYQFGVGWEARGTGFTPGGQVEIVAWDAWYSCPGGMGRCSAPTDELYVGFAAAAPLFVLGHCNLLPCWQLNPAAGTFTSTSTTVYPLPCASMYSRGVDIEAIDLTTGIVASYVWWAPPQNC
jgi:hypothetical protein